MVVLKGLLARCRHDYWARKARTQNIWKRTQEGLGKATGEKPGIPPVLTVPNRRMLESWTGSDLPRKPESDHTKALPIW